MTKGAEYLSFCDLVIDRYVGHLSRANLLAAGCMTSPSSPLMNLCNCSAASSAASHTYTGMMPIGLPVITNPSTPGVYPGGLPTPHGRWYSHPAGSA